MDEWVALSTFVDEAGGMFYEEGGVYDHEPRCHWTTVSRKRLIGEHEAVCPRCDRRFVATDEGTAESHRDRHFDGDEDCPSICRNHPQRRSFVAIKGGRDEREGA
jgi:hypothetical protein